MHSHPVWPAATKHGILALPSGEGYEKERWLTHIVPVWTKARDNHHLAAHLQYDEYTAWPVDYPVVPKGQGRIRLVFHAHNTPMEVDGLIKRICEWAQEILDFKLQGKEFSCEWWQDVKMLEGFLAEKKRNDNPRVLEDSKL